MNIGIWLLRLMPVILLFYIPALMGMALLKERGGAYRIKAGLWFAIGFGSILMVQLVMTTRTAIEAAQALGFAALYIALALALAAFTVNRLAD